MYNVSNALQVEVSKFAETSRAEYMKSRRETRKTFSVVLDRNKLERFEKHLNGKGQTKTEWLNRKIDEELGK
nr:MAG TPA: hypothetical protein [Caudoviricetes sp.]